MRKAGFFLTLAGFALTSLTGCGTTRMTDTARSATEMLLISQAIDHSVNQLDFTVLAGKPVFFEEKVLDGTTDKGYLASSLRSKMLADGCLLVEEKAKAVYVVEARSGCVGTDKQSLLVGIPQMNLPTIMPGQPPAIPEMPLVKSTDQQGVAKIAVFAYNRVTGRAVWQSGVQEKVSRSKDTWVLGAGPFQKGNVRNHVETPIEQLDVLGIAEGGKTDNPAQGRVGVTQAAFFKDDTRPGLIQAATVKSATPVPGTKTAKGAKPEKEEKSEKSPPPPTPPK